MNLGWVGLTQLWSEEVRTSRWTSRWTSRGTTGGTSGSTLKSLFSWLLRGLDKSDEPRMGWFDSSIVKGG